MVVTVQCVKKYRVGKWEKSFINDHKDTKSLLIQEPGLNCI